MKKVALLALTIFTVATADYPQVKDNVLLQAQQKTKKTQWQACGVVREQTAYTGCGYTYLVEADRNQQCGGGGTTMLILDSHNSNGATSCGLTRSQTAYTGCGYTYLVEADRNTQCGGGGTTMLIFDSYQFGQVWSATSFDNTARTCRGGGGSWPQYGRQVASISTLEDCMSRCESTSGCNFIQFQEHRPMCHMYDDCSNTRGPCQNGNCGQTFEKA